MRRASVSPDELRTLFLFESLDEGKLSWLSERGYCESSGRRLGGLQRR